MKTGYCNLPNGEQIFYREAGEGPQTLLLLHGNAASSYFFEPFFPQLKGCRVIAPDMRGYGESSYNKPFGSLMDLAEDFAAFCDELKITSLFVGGWSLGGAVALQLAAIRPDLVKGLILISAVSTKGFPIPPKDENGLPKIGTYYESRETFVNDPAVTLIRMSIQNKDFATLKYVFNSMIFTKYRPSEDEYNAYLEEVCKQRSSDDAYWALSTFNMSSESNGMRDGSGHIDNVKCPVLAYHGDADIVLPLFQAQETKACLGDRMQLVVLDNCGHASFLDYPEVVGGGIVEFMAKQ